MCIDDRTRPNNVLATRAWLERNPNVSENVVDETSSSMKTMYI